MDFTSPFTPIPVVSATETNEFVYEPTNDLRLAFDNLRDAISECQKAPSFDSVLPVCRKCRTAFAEFTGEAASGGPVARAGILPEMLELLQASEMVILDAMKLISDPEQLELAQGYLRHIRRREELAEAMKTRGLEGFLDEIRKRLPAPVETADLAGV